MSDPDTPREVTVTIPLVDFIDRTVKAEYRVLEATMKTQFQEQEKATVLREQGTHWRTMAIIGIAASLITILMRVWH